MQRGVGENGQAQKGRPHCMIQRSIGVAYYPVALHGRVSSTRCIDKYRLLSTRWNRCGDSAQEPQCFALMGLKVDIIVHFLTSVPSPNLG